MSFAYFILQVAGVVTIGMVITDLVCFFVELGKQSKTK